MASSTLAAGRVTQQDSWLARARVLGPMIDTAAAADEDATEIAGEVVRAIDEAGLYAIMVPREAGRSTAWAS